MGLGVLRVELDGALQLGESFLGAAPTKEKLPVVEPSRLQVGIESESFAVRALGLLGLFPVGVNLSDAEVEHRIVRLFDDGELEGLEGAAELVAP